MSEALPSLDNQLLGRMLRELQSVSTRTFAKSSDAHQSCDLDTPGILWRLCVLAVPLEGSSHPRELVITHHYSEAGDYCYDAGEAGDA